MRYRFIPKSSSSGLFEVLGQKWDSIYFDSERLTIKHTVAKVVKTIEKNQTQNSASHRPFPLSQKARAIFLDVKNAEQESRRLFGKNTPRATCIFKWPDGSPFAPDYVSQYFALFLKNKGLPHIRFHELRHSCASLLLSNGFTLKDVQEYFGHADIQMTVNIKNSHMQKSLIAQAA